MAKRLPLGPLVMDVSSTSLTSVDKERLCHPLVGGVILFSRHYENSAQLSTLCRDIHALRSPSLLIFVDQEGGRVQRFKEGFTQLPSMGALGALYERDENLALSLSYDVGCLLALELRAHGVDMSFTPVLDLDWGRSEIIGSRAFSKKASVVSVLAAALMKGLGEQGMLNCGKHFPGHGFVIADSHVAMPIDERPLSALLADDLIPYAWLSSRGLSAVMMAHVVYPEIDNTPAGFSSRWINYLRNELSFNGVIFSDDLSMEGAAVMGNMLERALAAVSAGCDIFLICNDLESVDYVLDGFPLSLISKSSVQRVMSLLPKQACPVNGDTLRQDALWCTLSERLLGFK